MKTILFCVNPYAYGILKPLYDELLNRGYDILWYVDEKIASSFPFKENTKSTSSIAEVYDFKSDIIFVPGNEVPHYLRGVKVQVFHGLAGEKKGHFRIRTYFDLYLTQGPYFTERFVQLSHKYKDFEVKETGWCKLDYLFQNQNEYKKERDLILKKHNKENLILYAPTFSPSLTCAISRMDEIFALADTRNVFIQIKFHDLMDALVVEQYKAKARERNNVEIVSDKNIIKYLIMADMMISDTSSVVYEFLLLNKPVITIDSKSENIRWCNITGNAPIITEFDRQIRDDEYKNDRQYIISQYHPYTDGGSSARMIDATEEYIKRNGIPERRKLSLYRRLKINKLFGKQETRNN